MRRLGLVIVLSVVALAIAPDGLLASPPRDAPRCRAPDTDAAFVPGELLIRFRPGVGAQRGRQIAAAENATRSRRIPAIAVDVLRLPPGLSVQQAVKRFCRHPEVEYAEPNYILSALVVDDPGLSNQWAPQRIAAPAAWTVTTGDPAVIIAVVDSGVDYRHGELAPNMWVNADEIAGNGVDDDNNGYADDRMGWDFISSDADPFDDYGHGTHVAGIAAAVDNEEPEGLVGICPSCTLMPVKVLDAGGTGPTDVVADGITYAAINGAKARSLWPGQATTVSKRCSTLLHMPTSSLWPRPV